MKENDRDPHIDTYNIKHTDDYNYVNTILEDLIIQHVDTNVDGVMALEGMLRCLEVM